MISVWWKQARAVVMQYIAALIALALVALVVFSYYEGKAAQRTQTELETHKNATKAIIRVQDSIRTSPDDPADAASWLRRFAERK